MTWRIAAVSGTVTRGRWLIARVSGSVSTAPASSWRIARITGSIVGGAWRIAKVSGAVSPPLTAPVLAAIASQTADPVRLVTITAMVTNGVVPDGYCFDAGTTIGAPTIADSFTGANGAALSSSWQSDVGFTTIQSNAARTVVAASGYNFEGFGRDVGLHDVDAQITATPVSSGVEQYTFLEINSDAGAGLPYAMQPNSYFVQVNWGVSSSTVQLVQRISGTNTILATATVPTAAATRIRLQRLGTLLKVKLWDATTSEPDAWSLRAYVAGNLTGTTVAVHSMNGGDAVSRSFSYDDFQAAAPSSALPLTVSGNTATFLAPATPTGGTVAVTVAATKGAQTSSAQTASVLVSAALGGYRNSDGTIHGISYPYLA